MRKIAAGLLGLLLLSFASAQAAPDPRDSIILESKCVAPNLTGAPAFALKIYITNKDSLEYMVLALRESTIVGSAYALLNRNLGGFLTFSSVVNPLTGTLRYNFGSNFATYNDNSPDRFLFGAGYDGYDQATVEPPNSVRKAIWELKFRHTSDSMGLVEFDSTRINGQSIYFTTSFPWRDVTVNFQKANFEITSNASLGLLEPENFATLSIPTPTLVWKLCPELGSFLPATYRVILADNPSFSLADTSPVLSDTVFSFPNLLAIAKTYYWKVLATLTTGDTVVSPVHIFTVQPAFLLIAPANGISSVRQRPTFLWHPLRWDNSATDAVPATYRVLLSMDAFFTSSDSSPILEDTTWTKADTLSSGQTYYWKVVAITESADTVFSQVQTFEVIMNHPPGGFGLISPPNGSKIARKTISFDWADAIDTDPSDTVRYALLISPDSLFLSAFEFTGVNSSSFFLQTNPLTRGVQYYWKVLATDEGQDSTFSNNIFRYNFLKLGDANGDGLLSAADIILILYHLFLGPDIEPWEAADMDCSGAVSPADLVIALNTIFSEILPPCNP